MRKTIAAALLAVTIGAGTGACTLTPHGSSWAARHAVTADARRF